MRISAFSWGAALWFSSDPNGDPMTQECLRSRACCQGPTLGAHTLPCSCCFHLSPGLGPEMTSRSPWTSPYPVGLCPLHFPFVLPPAGPSCLALLTPSHVPVLAQGSCPVYFPCTCTLVCFILEFLFRI